jgi:hypothetical protein
MMTVSRNRILSSKCLFRLKAEMVNLPTRSASQDVNYFAAVDLQGIMAFSIIYTLLKKVYMLFAFEYRSN